MASRSRARRIVLPARGLAWAGGFWAVVAVLSLAHPLFAGAWWATGLAIALLALADLLTRPAAGQLVVERTLPSELIVGREGAYRLTVTNAGAAPLHVSLRERLPRRIEAAEPEAAFTLEPGQAESLDVAFLCVERGPALLGPATVRVSRPFGLLAYQEEADGGDAIRIRPGRPQRETGALLARAQLLADAGERRLRRKGQDREFESMREYVAGDAYRSIDWKATARRRKPHVREYQVERNAEILLALDCGRLMGTLVHGVRKLDLAMTPLLDLAAVALKRRDRVGLLAFDGRPRGFLLPRGGTPQLGRMRDLLAGLDVAFEPTSYTRALLQMEARRRKRSLIVVLTDFTDEVSAEEMMETMAALCRRHVLVFCGVSDPQLRSVLVEEPANVAAAYQKGVAAELLLERRRVLERLNRMGAFTVDAEPGRLSAPLINRFLEARLAHS